MVSFGVAGGRDAAERFMSALDLAQIATPSRMHVPACCIPQTQRIVR